MRGIKLSIFVSWFLRISTFVLIFLCYFENFPTPFPFFNYSDKLILIIGLIDIFFLFFNKNLKIVNSFQLSIFLLYILFIIFSSIFGVNFKNSLTELRFLFTGFVLFLVFGSECFDVVVNKNRFILWMILGLVVSIFSIYSFVDTENSLNVIKSFFGESYYNIFSYDFLRGRLIPIGAIYLTFLAPIFFIHKKNTIISKIILLCFLILNIFSVIVSNYRSAFLIMILGLISIFTVPFLKISRKLLFFVLVTSVMFILFISNFTLGNSVFNRFLLKSDKDIVTIESRMSYIYEAIDIFKQKPFFGVGYGNFGIVSEPMFIDIHSNGETQWNYSVPGNPHNQFFSVLSEVGIFGLFIYLILLLSFFISDLKFFLYNRDEKNICLYFLIIFSWVYIFGVFLDSWSFQLFYSFCIFRGIIWSVNNVDVSTKLSYDV